MVTGREAAASPELPDAYTSYKLISSALSMTGGVALAESAVPLDYKSGMYDEPHRGFLCEPRIEEIAGLAGDIPNLLEPEGPVDQLVAIGASAKSSVYGALLPRTLAQFALEKEGGYSIEELRSISRILRQYHNAFFTGKRQTPDEFRESGDALQRMQPVRSYVMAMGKAGLADDPARPLNQTGLLVYANPREEELEVTRFGVNPVFAYDQEPARLPVDIALQRKLDNQEIKADVGRRMLAVMARVISPGS